MTQLEEAVARYHKTLESDTVRTSDWVAELRDQMAARRLVVAGRPISPVLRPHFLSRRQYINVVKSAESLHTAIDRLRLLVIHDPQLMARMEMLPAEKMLAAVDPGYASPAISALLETHVNNGTLQVTGGQADLPHGVVYGEILSDLFYELAPVKDIRKRFRLEKVSAVKPLLAALLKAWKEFGGRTSPRIAILEFKQPFQTVDAQEHLLLAEGLPPRRLRGRDDLRDQMEHRGGVLARRRRGGRCGVSLRHGARVHAALRPDASAGARLPRRQGLRRQQLQDGNDAQAGAVRAAER